LSNGTEPWQRFSGLEDNPIKGIFSTYDGSGYIADFLENTTYRISIRDLYPLRKENMSEIVDKMNQTDWIAQNTIAFFINKLYFHPNEKIFLEFKEVDFILASFSKIL